MNRAVLRRGPAARIRANRIGARLLLDLARRTGHVLTVNAGDPEGVGHRAESAADALLPIGALVGFPPDRRASTGLSLRQLGLLVRQGVGPTLRWGAVQAALTPIRPAEPHWTLAMVGVEPDEQASGVGAALVARWVEGLAGSDAPAWVETDRPELVSFYARFGFEPEARAHVHGVEVVGLRRNPG